MGFIPVLMFIVIIVASLLFASVKILQEYERAVVFRLGRYASVRGPGLIILIPYIERMVRVNLRTIVMDVPAQDIITRDNVSVKVSAVVYFRVIAPDKSILAVEDVYYATSQLSQTTLRSIVGQFELDDLLANRDKINIELQSVIDHQTEPWGIKVSSVEVKHIDLPADMQKAMARQAEAERERRAKIINAEGEYEAATKLSEASAIMESNPITLQLRYLQTLSDISGKGNATIIPIPLELLQILKK
ncbi:MAG: slipin family protein [Deferribacteraceae bacterium]|jgi:regulator of protease activity HflC (stomatin/prohibitin superfamily)|nr:slipin family protein [Deferribacteraceae bacterium]